MVLLFVHPLKSLGAILEVLSKRLEIILPSPVVLLVKVELEIPKIRQVNGKKIKIDYRIVMEFCITPSKEIRAVFVVVILTWYVLDARDGIVVRTKMKS
jgi:hypothetical protein